MLGPRVELDMRAALNTFFLVKFYELNYVFLGVGGCSRLLDVSWDWWRGWQPVTVRSQPVIQTTDRDTSTTAWNTHPVIQLNTTSVMGSQSAVPASHMIYPHQLRHINLPPSPPPRPSTISLPLYFILLKQAGLVIERGHWGSAPSTSQSPRPTEQTAAARAGGL